MSKKRKSKIDRSYEAYSRIRNEWEAKGYALADKLSKDEYKDYYLDAKDAGMSQNFARRMAADDRRVNYSQSAQIYHKMDSKMREKYKIGSSADIRSNPQIHSIITDMFAAGLIDDRKEFEKSLGY